MPQVRVYGLTVSANASAVELEAVGVDGGTVGVIVGVLHGVLEEELGRGRATLIVGLAHGGANGEVNLRCVGDRHGFVEGHSDVHHVVQFVGVVLS